MSFDFTVCKVADAGKVATKAIFGRSDGSFDKRDYDKVSRWYFAPMSAPDHNTMARMLGKLARREDCMIIMGALRSGLDPRRDHARTWTRDNATLIAPPRSWLAIDADDYSVPAPFGLAEHLTDAALAVRDDALGEAFAGVRCVVTPTSSTGLVGEELARLRLYFKLDQSFEIADLRRWAQGAQSAGLPVDPAVIQAGQPIYTSRPIFKGLACDPVPERLHAFVLPGVDDCISLDVHEHDREAEEIEYRVREATATCGDDWRRLLDETLGGPASFFRPLTQALGIAAHSPENEAEIAGHVTFLLARRADEKRRRQYGQPWVLSTLRRFRRADARAHGEIEQMRQALFLTAEGMMGDDAQG